MEHHGQPFFGAQVERSQKRRMVDVRWLTVRERRQVIVAAHDLADTLPEVRVDAQKLAYDNQGL